MVKLIHYSYLSRHNPQELADRLYIDETGNRNGINWNSPVDLNEKINWLKFNSDTTKWSELADKYAVRKFIEEKGYKQYLVPLLGVWENANEIDFSKLPDSFVLKTNNGAGTVMVVEDKTLINQRKVRAQLNKWLKNKFGLKRAEPHYLRIKPLIIAESLLRDESGISSSLVDYKIWCFDGKAFGTRVYYNRHRFEADIEWYDRDWNYRPEKLVFTKDKRDGGGKISKPKHYEKMISFAEDLSKGFPQVRIDLYNIDGQIYFGEMTFTASGGYHNTYSKEALLEMGRLTNLPTDI
ncbi:MAG: hypothetical protein MJZ03_04395 [archaeon]|nr:hypothetical protein [archaeon]